MANPTIKLEIPGLAELIEKFEVAPEAIDAANQKLLEASAILMQSEVKREVPNRNGKLEASIDYTIAGNTATVFPNLKKAPYAAYVEFGTGLYGPNRKVITPKNSKVFATKINPGWGTKNSKGYFIIGRSIKGQHPNPFMERAYKSGKIKVLALVAATGEELKGVFGI